MSDNSLHQRIDKIVSVLERLARDVEIIRKGSAALRDVLPPELTTEIKLLSEQADALDRISIALGMVQHATASLLDAGSDEENSEQGAILHCG
ncbi:MAG: hypothetical protein LIP28_02125 [Deltaproteobacteria bacterium]|nr:hypothetical protein [Deltaproteobacteria bacterium]